MTRRAAIFAATLLALWHASPLSLAGEPPGVDPLPSLNELLGLPPDNAASASGEGDLERLLSPQEMSAEFERAVELMDRSARRLADARDADLPTQRLQEEVLRTLDRLIDAAERRQQEAAQGQAAGQSRARPGERPQSQPSPQAGQNQQRAQGDSSPDAQPPGRQDGPLGTPPAATASWGSLPAHVRDALRQGFGDRFSSLYRSVTEAYYRRLAEEPKP